MRIPLSLTVLFFCLTTPLLAQRCRCIQPAPGETTRAGANEEIVMVDKKKYRMLHGVVRNDEVLAGVLVEVFDHPEHLLLSYPANEQRKQKQRRIAACVTGADGSFCFRGIPAGKYELLLSKDGGWKRSHVVVVVAPGNRKGSKSALALSMQVGT